jgi:hypothetical protein
MSETETPDYVTVVEPTYVEVEHGQETFDVRKYDTGALQCPECTQTCDTTKGLKQHFTHCHNITARIEYECAREGCDETFEQLKSKDKQFCSQSCAMKEQHTSNTEVCEYCDDKFKASPSQERMYCSDSCYRDAHRETQTCPTCETTFEAQQSKEQTYCSRKCFHRRHWGDVER